MILKKLSRFNVDNNGLVRVFTASPDGMGTQSATSEGWLPKRALNQWRNRGSRPPARVQRFTTAGTNRTTCSVR
jgi:hypothetical protein